MLSFTKKNNTPATAAVQTVEPASSSVAATSKEPASSSAVKKTLFVRASRRVQKMLGLKKTVVAQLAPETRVVFELGPASDPYRNHARLSPSSSFNSVGVDLTRTTTTHRINRFSRYDSLLPVVVVPSSAAAPACPELSPTSSFSSSLESSSPSTPSLTSLNEAAHHPQGTDADKKMKLNRADRVRMQRRRPAPAFSRSHTSHSSSSTESDSPSSFGIYTIVPHSVTNSTFVGRPWEEKKKGFSKVEAEVQGDGEGYSKEAVEAVRMETRDVGAGRTGFILSQVPVGVLEGDCEAVVEWM